MLINVDQLKALVEAGDKSAIEQHILNVALEKSDVYSVLEKGDVVAAAAVNADVKSELDSEKDKHHDTALATFKEKKLPGLLEEAKNEVRKELNPEETPEQAKIRELEERLNKEQQQRTRAEVRAALVELATGEEVGLDAAFVAKHIDKFVPASFEFNENGEVDVTTIVTSAKTELVGLSEDFKTVVSTRVEEVMKGTARTDVGGGIPGATPPKEVTLGEQLALENQQTKAKEGQSKFFQ